MNTVLPVEFPYAGRIRWLPQIQKLKVRRHGDDEENGREDVIQWLGSVLLGYTTKLQTERRYLRQLQKLLSQNARTKSIAKLFCWARRPGFELEDLDSLSTVDLASITLSGRGCAALAARFIDAKACSTLRKLELLHKEANGFAADKASLRAVHRWAAGREGIHVTYNHRRLEDIDLGGD